MLFQKLKMLQKSGIATPSLVEGGADSDMPLTRLVPEGASSNSVSHISLCKLMIILPLYAAAAAAAAFVYLAYLFTAMPGA